MPEPRIAAKNPAVVDLEPGTYSWCTCGESARQPFCDGSHREKGEFRSLKFEVSEPCKKALCQCKQTRNQPYCDGRHKEL